MWEDGRNLTIAVLLTRQFTIPTIFKQVNPMKLSKKTAKKAKKSKVSSSTGGAQKFLVIHCEKFVLGVVVAVALVFAFQGLVFLGPQVSWHPDEVARTAEETRTAIQNGTRSAADEGIEIVDHAANALHIRNPLVAEPYRTMSPWHPILDPRQQPLFSGSGSGSRGGFGGSSSSSGSGMMGRP